jgi:2-phosphosulfolactate phosphatase
MVAPIRTRKLGLLESGQAKDVAVVIDVLRAFSAEAYAFAQGAREISAVRTVTEALERKRLDPALLLMGEEYGYRVPGFDFGNSPAELAAQDLTGRRLVHRSSAGTQGVVTATRARVTLVASLVCARATAEYLRKLQPRQVDYIITGRMRDHSGEDDAACADYIDAMLQGQPMPPRTAIERVLASDPGQMFLNKEPDHPWRADLDYCLQVDRFDFVMLVERSNGDCLVRKLDARG